MHPSYTKVFLTFARNSLVRDMSFRMNFILQCLSSMSWALMNWGLFKIIYQYTGEIGRGSGWHENEFFVFLGTVWIINSLIQTFFMANAEEFSELIRTGNLDFALLKPIDTQFLISFPRLNFAQIPNGLLGLFLVIWSLGKLSADTTRATPIDISVWNVLAFLFFVGCGAVVMYSVMIILASTSIWLGRNQNLYTFWFYITNFYRYPMEIYQRTGIGMALWGTFTFVIPILVVSNVPARVLAQPLGTPWKAWEWGLAGFAIFAAGWSLYVSRWVFRRALLSYRSASS
jgi:ABC-2 type transport system permease protein